MIRPNLPALVIIVPLLAALVTSFLRRGPRAWAWVTLVTWAVCAMCIALLREVLANGPISYPMGSWKLPWAIEYRVDALNAFVLVIVSAIAAVVTFSARASVAKEIAEDRQHLFYTVWLLCVTGLLGITVTGDAFNVYVLLEVASLSSYTLIAMGKDRDRRALTASLNYVILGTVGASFILIGIGYLYAVTGTLNMDDLAARLRALYARWDQGDFAYRRSVIAAFAFVMSGFAIKLALFPLHTWLPNAYTYAPSAVSSLLSATATKVYAYIGLRFLFTILGAKFCFEMLPTGAAVVVCGSLAVIVGSYFAFRQTNVKRLLAYSSVAQIGYIAIGIGLATPEGLQGSIVHLFNHAVMKGGLFVALAAVALGAGGVQLSDLRGLGRRMPFTMAAIVVGGLAIIGMPLTAGFISKWYLVLAAIQKAGSYGAVAAVAIVVGSLLAVAYVWRVVEVAYFHPSEGPVQPIREPWSVVVPAWILVGASVFFGVNATLTSRLSGEAMRALMGGAP